MEAVPHPTGAASRALVARLQAGGADASRCIDPAWELPPLTELARSRTTDTAVVHLPAYGRVVRKRWRWPRLSERLKGLGRTTAWARSPAEREMIALGIAPEAGFHPEPLAWAAWRERGLLTRCMLVMTEVAGAVDLAQWLLDTRERYRRRAVLDDLAGRVRTMHASGIVDGDLHPRNVLVDPVALRTWNVDCARQRRFARAPTRRMIHDLASLDVGLARLATRTERLRALRKAAPDGNLRDVITKISEIREGLAPDEEPRLPPGALEPRD